MNKNTIEMKQLGFFAYHGATEEEARLGQRFYLDVTLELDASLRFDDDLLEKTVNYADIYTVVESEFTGRRYQLIESAAEAICSAVLKQFGKITQIGVRVKKPSVPVDCLCDYFAVEVSRCR